MYLSFSIYTIVCICIYIRIYIHICMHVYIYMPQLYMYARIWLFWMHVMLYTHHAYTHTHMLYTHHAYTHTHLIYTHHAVHTQTHAFHTPCVRQTRPYTQPCEIACGKWDALGRPGLTPSLITPSLTSGLTPSRKPTCHRLSHNCLYVRQLFVCAR